MRPQVLPQDRTGANLARGCHSHFTIYYTLVRGHSHVTGNARQDHALQREDVRVAVHLASHRSTRLLYRTLLIT